MHFINLTQNRLGKEKADKCLRWAFGENYDDEDSRFLPLRWNERHSDLYLITSEGNVRSDLMQIIKLWSKTDGI